MQFENKKETGKALKLGRGGGTGMLRMLKHTFSCEETRETQAAVVIPTLCCTVKQLIKIGWWQIKSVIHRNSKPLFAELQISRSGSVSDFFCLHCPFAEVSLPPHSISIAKYIWSFHWEQLSRTELVHISKAHHKNTKVRPKLVKCLSCGLPLSL